MVTGALGLQESDDGRNVVLDVTLPKYLDSSLIEVRGMHTLVPPDETVTGT